MTVHSDLTYAVIGAGPSGLAGLRTLDRYGFDTVGYEIADDVGGLWNIGAPRSTMYDSAHLISSRSTTQFTEFPMPAGTPDYPSHRELFQYFTAFADEFDLRRRIRFGTEVVSAVPVNGGRDGWDVTSRTAGGTESTERHAGVLAANGTLSEPSIPVFQGQFDGELFHTSRYRSATVLAGKRVLIIGAGNSGCDIAVDAVHHAASVDLSVRRGYYFVPKYLFGKPADTLNQGRPLPARIKQMIDSRVLKLFTGDPVSFGFPKPDHKIYESHPVVNSLVLHHLGHGDIRMRRDVERFDGTGVRFVGDRHHEGERGEYDVVVLATGYRLHYPFLDPALLSWSGKGAPDLYLNIVPRTVENLWVLGMVEASGLGWQGRYEQAELVAALLKARRINPIAARTFDTRVQGPPPDLTGGYRYLGLDRMAYYVNKDAYRSRVRRELADLGVQPS